MSYLSEAHAEWHAVNGHDAVCPLDCGVGEVYDPWDAMTDEEIAAYEAYVPEPSYVDTPFVVEGDPWDQQDFDPPF